MSSIADQIDALEPGLLRVFRDSDNDIGFREAIIFLDGEKIGWVDYKHVLETPLKPGTHTLRAFNRILHSKPVEFNVGPGERVTFQVANVGGFIFKVLMMLTMGIPSIRLNQETAGEAEAPQHSNSKRMLR
jgi:hypothetical protein